MGGGQKPGSARYAMKMHQIHTPVMRERCFALLAPALTKPGAILVDGTLGMGGHAEVFLERIPNLRLVGFDRDAAALEIARERLARFGDQVCLVHAVFDLLRSSLEEIGIDSVDGLLFDLGVSSLQLDQVERGVSYSKDAPLDMRMDATATVTAATILARYTEDELRRLFWEYGEEKLAPRFAKRIVEARQHTPIRRSAQLVEIIADATPAALQRTGHPAKRVFQALRIEVNHELGALTTALPQALSATAPHGRIVVLAYQSLEDRIVKRVFAHATASAAPVGLPVELPEHRPEFRLLVRGAEMAPDDERATNSRATPVRLRAAERIKSAA